MFKKITVSVRKNARNLWVLAKAWTTYILTLINITLAFLLNDRLYYTIGTVSTVEDIVQLRGPTDEISS